MLVERFDEARLLAFAKGWTLDALAEEISEQIKTKKRPELADLSLSATTLQRRSVTSRHAPRPLAELVEELKTFRGREHLTEIVETGLRVLRGQSEPSKRDPRELAIALLAHFPTDEFALKLAEALASGGPRKRSPLAALARRVARVVAKRLQGTFASGAHDALEATINHMDAKVDLIDAKIDRSEVQRRKDKRDVILVVCAVGVCASVLAQCQHGSAVVFPGAGGAEPTAVYQQIALHLGTELRDGTGQLEQWTRVPYLGNPSGNMGERKPKGPRMMPHHALPGQAVKPCPDSATLLYDACWLETTKTAPCPSDLFQEGTKCYAPIQADPNVPVGEYQQQPNPEHRQ